MKITDAQYDKLMEILRNNAGACDVYHRHGKVLTPECLASLVIAIEAQRGIANEALLIAHQYKTK